MEYFDKPNADCLSGVEEYGIAVFERLAKQDITDLVTLLAGHTSERQEKIKALVM